MLLLALWAGAAWAEARLIGTYVWRSGTEGFGGFSGIEVSEDGRSFVAITDRGLFAQGTLRRTGDRIVAVNDATLLPILTTTGQRPGALQRDSEGLARSPDGRLFVSFERLHRVRSFAGPGQPAGDIGAHPDFDQLQFNAGLEALAVRGDTLIAIPERSGVETRPFPVYRYDRGRWDIAFALPRRGRFLVTGADILGDRLYVLERDATPIGFRSRVRRFNLSGGAEEVLLKTLPGVHDNLEGISAWQDGAGRIRLTMIADDNFRSFQRTEIVEYMLD